METFLQSKEIKVPKANKMHQGTKIDFKSSFARSLSYSNNDFDDASFEIDQRACNESSESNENENENAICDKKLASLDEDLVVGDFNESFNKSDEIKSKERQLWSKQQVSKINNSDPIFGTAFLFLRSVTLIKLINTFGMIGERRKRSLNM
jgi:hypothetical protein